MIGEKIFGHTLLGVWVINKRIKNVFKTSKFDKAIDKLVVGIGDDYQKWSSPLKTDDKGVDKRFQPTDD